MKVRTFDFVAKRYLSRPTKSGGEKRKKTRVFRAVDSKFRDADKEGSGAASKMFGRSPSGRRQAARRGPDKPRIFLRSR